MLLLFVRIHAIDRMRSQRKDFRSCEKRRSASERNKSNHEKDLPTKQSQTCSYPWISQAPPNQRRTRCAQATPLERPQAPDDSNIQKVIVAVCFRRCDERSAVDAHQGADQQARLRFPKARRLLRRSEFVAVQRRGKRYPIGPLIACARKQPDSPTRVGITTSKRVGGAVIRNRVRRLFRESIRRLLLPAVPDGFDIVLIAKNDLSFALTQAEVDQAITQLIAQLLAPVGTASRNRRPKQQGESPGSNTPGQNT